MVELPSPSGDPKSTEIEWIPLHFIRNLVVAPQVFIVHQPSLPDKKGSEFPLQFETPPLITSMDHRAMYIFICTTVTL